METKQIIAWLEGLINAKDNFGQQGSLGIEYILGYIESANSLLAILKKEE